MHFALPVRRLAGGSALGAALIGAVAAVAVANPAVAAGALAALQNAVTCASNSACFLATNSSTGPGVAGTSTSGIGVQGKGVTGVKGIATTNYGVFGQSNSGYGMFGSSTSGTAGVAGTTASGYGVYGYTTGGGTGVYASSLNGYGMYGTTSSGSGIGVVGNLSGAGTGVYGASASGYGVEALSSTGNALYGHAYGSGTAAYLTADSGGYGLISYSAGSVAVFASNSSGNGADLRGSYIGSVSRAPSSGFPIVATDPAGNNLFYVDGGGNVSYHGGLFKFAFVPGGAMVKSFTPNTTLPTVEDTGTAQLVGGSASVPLEPTFAASIDRASSYRVFVTPNGDTRGLFVALKTPNGFVVRESQGGRSSVSFDYRIVATAAGQAGQRMTVTNAALVPHAVAPNAPRIASGPALSAAPHPAAVAPR